MKNIIEVSIIIRAHNAQHHITKAIESALHQIFPQKNLEILVINDGSTDKTSDILASYGSRIRVISQRRKGAMQAANVGFQKAKGAYVILLDADDMFEPTIIKEMTSCFNRDPSIDFVYCDYYEKTPRGNIKVVSTKNVFHTVAGGIMFRKRQLSKEGFYNANILFTEYDLLLRTAHIWTGHHIAKPLFWYMRHQKSISAQGDWEKRAKDQMKKLYPENIKEINHIRSY